MGRTRFEEGDRSTPALTLRTLGRAPNLCELILEYISLESDGLMGYLGNFRRYASDAQSFLNQRDAQHTIRPTIFSLAVFSFMMVNVSCE